MLTLPFFAIAKFNLLNSTIEALMFAVVVDVQKESV
jgi:hypothetical protein